MNFNYILRYSQGNYEIVKYILEKDHLNSLNLKTKNNRTPLHTACLYGHLDIVKLLTDNCNDLLIAKDSCGINPLMDALQTDQLDIVKYLLETYDNKTINLFDRDKLNNSTIHLVCQSGSIKCLKFIFYKYFNQTSLLSELKTNLNCFNMTPLHSACKNNKETILEYILNELNNIHYITDLIKQQDIHNRSAYDIALSMSINQTNNKNNCLIILNKFY